MAFVQAKCPECGGMLAVDADKKAAVCQFCGEAFIVQEAINNYNTYNETINNYNTTHQYGDGAVVNVYEEQNKDFVIEAGVLKEYHGESQNVIIPDNVVAIACDCFKGQSIKSLTINSNIPIYDICRILKYSIEKFEVGASCVELVTENQMVFDKAKTLLIWIPKADESCFCKTLPNTVKDFSDIAKRNSITYQSLYYCGIDLLHLECDNQQMIDRVKHSMVCKLSHLFIDERCEKCGAYSFYKTDNYLANGNVHTNYITFNSSYCDTFSLYFGKRKILLEFTNFWNVNNLKEDDIKKTLANEKMQKYKKLKYNKLIVCGVEGEQGTYYHCSGTVIKHLVRAILDIFTSISEVIIEDDIKVRKYKGDVDYDEKGTSILVQNFFEFDNVKLGPKFSELENKKFKMDLKLYKEKEQKQNLVYSRIMDDRCPYCGGFYNNPLFSIKRCKSCHREKSFGTEFIENEKLLDLVK